MKSPEEIELEKKRQYLAGLMEQQSEAERKLASVKAEIRAFENSYEQIIGSRIAELDQLEWQINGLLDKPFQEDQDSEYSYTAGAGIDRPAAGRTTLLDDDPETTANIEEKSLKSLYREVAKLIHPDLARDDHERFRRQELMAIANMAYSDGDRSRLHNILKEWRLGPDTVKGLDIGAELVRVIRQIAHTHQNIRDLHGQCEELVHSEIYGLAQRVAEGLCEGVDLLMEMAAKLDNDILRSKKRLACLTGEDNQAFGSSASAMTTRIVSFPGDKPCGTLHTRPLNSVDYRDWQQTGTARGLCEIPLDRELRLDLKGVSETEVNCLKQLGADDLQSLFVYDADDMALTAISGLTGLQELYISNSTLSDNALKNLDKLKGLRRLYLYHTDITDAGLDKMHSMTQLVLITLSGTKVTEKGLAALKTALPGCKVVTFKWKYE